MKILFRYLIIFTVLAALAGCADDFEKNESAISSGEKAAANTEIASYVVMVYSPTLDLFCTGTLIHQRVVLTAGHCAFKDPAGLILAFGTEPLKKYKKRISQKVITLPEYKSGDADRSHDLAMILMTEAAPAEYKPVAIPGVDFPFQKNLEFTALGYGQITGFMNLDGKAQGNGVLRYVNLKISGLSSNQKTFYVSQTEGKGICHGDSGGPALMRYLDKDYIVGVASAVNWVPGKNLDTCASQSEFVNVQAQRTWILSNLEILNRL